MRWLPLLLLAACGWPTEPHTGAGAYPHPPDYASSAHGEQWQADRASCVQCHSPTGDTASAGPACTTCHAAYPHPDGFQAGDVHGPEWGDTCTGCHGADGAAHPAGPAPTACVDCHATFPHPDGWQAPTQHGAAVVHRGGDLACSGCHGTEVAGAQMSCTAGCHPIFPHPAGWATGHGDSYQGGQSCGVRCHSSSDPLWTPTCASCHDVYPHPETWTGDHLAVVQARGEAQCRLCHAEGRPTGPAMPVSCQASCHGTTP